jgi:hypothetical protein
VREKHAPCVKKRDFFHAFSPRKIAPENIFEEMFRLLASAGNWRVDWTTMARIWLWKKPDGEVV